MYNPKLTACLILLAAFLSLASAQDSLVDKRDDFCDGNIPDIDMTEQQFENMRNSRDNIFYDNYREIVNYHANNDIGDLFEAFLPWAILLIILMAFCFISTIVFIVLCCGKYKKETSRTGVYTAFGCLFFWFYVPLFVAIIVFIAMSKHKYRRVYCTVYDIPASLIGGVNDSESKFLGLQNLNTMLTNFRGDLGDMTALSGSFNNIFAANPPSFTNAAWTTLINFVSTYENSRILNGEGVVSKPNSIRRLSPSVSDQIETDFVNIDMTAQRIQMTAEEGRRYQTASYRNTINSSLEAATIKIQSLIQELETLFNPFTKEADKAIDYAVIGFWVLLGVGSGLVIISFITLMILCCICTWQRCDKGRFPAKLLLVLIGILMLCFTVLVFIIMVGSVSGSGFCGFIAEVNRGNYAVFDELDEKVSDELITLFRTCADRAQSGNLRDILLTTATQREAYTSANTFLDGLLSYKIYQTVLRSETGSVGITNQVQEWTALQTGVRSDFLQVDRALAELNELVKCDDQVFYLSSVSCPADVKKTCKGIAELDTFAAPGCSDNTATTNQHFADLKAYLAEENVLMTNLIADLTTLNNTSPQGRFNSAQIALDGLSTSYNSIYNSMSTTLDVANEYQAPQTDLIDCRVLRRSLLNFEKESCFGFNYYVYIILVLAAVSAVLLFFLSWCICCALREEGTYDEASIIEDPYMDKQVIKEVGDVIDFEEKEIIPNY